MNKGFDWYLKWSSTGLLILGAITTSMQFTFINVLLSFLGNCGWLWAGLRMKETSLWVVSAGLLLIYLGGVIFAW